MPETDDLLNPRKSFMKNAQTQASSSPAGASPSPSVPISLYREVANELQSTRTNMESLKTQNQQLQEQNQQLRLEIERVVQSALHLRQVADSYKPIAPNPTPAVSESTLELHFDEAPAPANQAMPRPKSRKGGKGEKGEGDGKPSPSRDNRLVTEQDSQPHRVNSSDRTPEVSGWWLMLVIFLIVVTAFGMGFAILSSLMPRR